MKSITFRLLLGFLLLSLLPLAGLAWFYMQAFEQTLQQDKLESLSALANKKENQINTYLDERLNDSRTLASSPILLDALQTLSALHAPVTSPRYQTRAQPYQDYARTLRLENSGYHDLMLTDAAGNVVFSVLHEPDFGSNLNAGSDHDSPLAHAHQAAMQTLETQITPAHLYAPSNNKPAIFIVTPMLKDGKTIGTLDMQLNLDKLADVTTDRTGLGETGETVLAQREGEQMLYVGPLRHIADAAFHYRATVESRPPQMKAALLGKQGVGITYDYAGVGVISVWRYLPVLHWGMVVKMDTAEAYAPLYRLQKSIMAALGLSLLLAGLVAWLFGRALVAPIRKLIAATNQIAESDLSQRAPTLGWAESRQLAASFNRMTERLQSSHAELETLVAQRTAALTEALKQGQETQHTLKQSESLFRTLAQVAPVGIFRADAAGACIYVNEQYCKIAGTPMEAAMGGGWASAIHPDDRVRVVEAWQQSVSGNTPFQLEFRFRRPIGHVTWVVGQARAELGTTGEVLGYVGTLTDINQRKEHEAALQRFNDELEQRVGQRTALLLTAKEEAEAASRSKSLFLTSMSHELRTPLNAILGYAQLMQLDTGLPAHIVENAHEIRRAGDYLLTLLNDVLDLARIESGRMEVRIQAVDLPDIMQECRAHNARLAAERDIALISDDSCDSFKLKADRRRLLQVLNNLVSNAIKYNRDGGQVTLSCAAAGQGRVRISVTDTGMGIASDQQDQLFQPFNRLGAEMGKIEGTGVGLVICRRLLEAMDGVIGMSSEQGKGSTFWIELPTPEHAAPRIPTETAPLRTMPAKVPRVLVAEDYVPNQNVLRLQLRTLGCEVDIVADGAEALKKCRAAAYDLILTDLNMPIMDGSSLAMAVRKDEVLSGTRIPIVAITAAAISSELERCRAAGMDDTLTKPISLECLRAILIRWLGVAAEAPTLAKTLASVGEGSAILDIEHLYHVLGQVDLAQARNLIATFMDAAGAGLAQLVPGDAVAVAREMHKQKSSARTVGALRYAQLAEALEQQAGNGNGASADLAESLTLLRQALNEIEPAAANLRESAVTEAATVTACVTVNCRSILVVDDDPVVLQQVTSMLATLGVTEVLSARHGREAVEVLADSKVEVLLCDLNMPEMDGVELIREIGRSGFGGGLILMSGADEKVLHTVGKLAELQGLHVLGQLRKPVTPAQIAPFLALFAKVPKQKRVAFVAPEVTPDAIRQGMAENEFSIWFQPKVDSANLRAVGVEALARWKRADGRFIPPDIFITVAEQLGLIGELSQLLVATALAEGAKLFAAGYPLKIAVNLSGRWLDDLNLPDFILARTQAANLKVDDVILEVTETGVMEDLTTALDVLTRLRIKGFGLSIDDFGIGYSSFEQLGRIPFTEMKLDRSFVSRGTHDDDARAILESSMDMARKLGLSTVAEGVETEQDLELVRTIGCDRVQGYLIAKPMPVDDLITWLNAAEKQKGAA